MIHFKRICLFLCTCAALGALIACSDDSGTDDNSTEDEVGIDSGASTGGAGTGGSSGEPDSGTGGGEPEGGSGGGATFEDCGGDTPIFDEATASCLTTAEAEATCIANVQEAQPGTSIDDPSCGAGCTCVNCQQQMLDCANDPEEYCDVIVACANRVGCTGVACYAPATCQAEIDAAPGGGLSSLSVALATELSNCTAPEGAAAVCAPSCE